MSAEVVVYTALYGGYYKDIPAAAPQLDAQLVAFTDQAGLRAPGWEVRVVQRPEAVPRLQAKWFKLHPHLLFPAHAVSIWIDAGWQITSRHFAQECAACLGHEPVMFYPHRWRDSVRDEVAASTHPKFNGLPLQAQVQHYYRKGFPDNLGLLECTSILWWHGHPAVQALGAAWWAECLRWSHADQLSLPYLLWALDTEFGRFPFNLSEQPWFRLAHWRAD